MIHVGDITKLRGDTLEPVDVVVGGSPCQDLSVAGYRKGMAGERSGLFMEQIRVIKELREHDRYAAQRANRNIRPRYMVWENVEGALTSPGGDRKGEDFKAVLEETVKIVCPDAPPIPLPDGGSWNKSGAIMGRSPNGTPFSVAWRLHDAQFWGVPQRRKRIALVPDFDGLSAPEILFEREGLCGDIKQGRETGESSPRAITESTRNAISFQERAGKPGGGKGILIQEERVGAISTFNNQSVFCLQGNATDRHAVVYDISRRHDIHDMGETCETIRANYGTGGLNTPVICGPLTAGQAKQQGDTPLIYGASSLGNYAPQVSPLRAAGGDNGGGSENLVCSSAVRRLTPLECERLQGFPDGWTDIGEWTDTKGKVHKESSDTARYKALGNSIALPFWFWLLRRISAQYARPATLGSLFDGIGGFPLCWERCNGKGTARWASEIEEFPIAVTKRHFPEGEE